MTELSTWPDATFEQLETVLRARSGLVFTPLRRSTVEGAARRVMQRVGVADPSRLVPLLEQDGAVFDDLMAEVTVGETYFFRERAHFTLLRETIIPHFKTRAANGQRLRAWSAGCSTGEEPYSIALALAEEGVAGTVIGTDVSRARLSAARRGEYRQWSFRGVPQATIDRNFTRAGDLYTLSADMRRAVDFRYLNLASDCYPSMSAGVWGMDVIFCRNVLIYFDNDTIVRVAKALLASLSADGWLLPGATDPPLQELVRCDALQTEAGIVYRPSRGGQPRRSRPQPVPRSATPIAPFVFSEALALKPLDDVLTAAAPPAAVPMRKLESAPTRSLVEEAYAARDYLHVAALVGPAVASESATAADSILFIRSLANLGRLDEAGRACATALDDFRDNAELHYLHAVLVAQGGQFAESARAAKRALYLDRTLVVAQLALGSALASDGDRAGAMRAFAASERLLMKLPADALVPASDGEPAGRLLEMTRVQAKLLTREDAA